VSWHQTAGEVLLDAEATRTRKDMLENPERDDLRVLEDVCAEHSDICIDVAAFEQAGRGVAPARHRRDAQGHFSESSLRSVYRAEMTYLLEGRPGGQGDGAILVGPTLDGVVSQVVDARNRWDATRYLSDVEVIAREATNAGRRTAVTGMLSERGFDWRLQPFPAHDGNGASAMTGANVLADVTTSWPGTGTLPVLLLGAHFDKIGRGSEGAYDNASGCAAVLELASRLRANPPKNCQVKLVFFDQEEVGLVGSTAFVDACKKNSDCPHVFINIDMVGRGDRIWAGSSNASHVAPGWAKDPVAAAIPQAEKPAETQLLDALRAGAGGTSFSVVQNRGTPQSDMLSFQFQALNAVGISQATPEDVEQISQLQEANKLYKSRTIDIGEAGKKVDWTDILRAVEELDRVHPSGNEVQFKAAMDRYAAAVEQQQPHVGQYWDMADNAVAELRGSMGKVEILRIIHGANDTLGRVDPESANRFIDVVERGLYRYDDDLRPLS
jgi:hypothetical protein